MQIAVSGWQICSDTDDQLGESVLWHPEEDALYRIDFYGPSVHRQERNGGQVKTWRADSDKTIGSLIFASEGRLILAVDHGLHLFHTKTGTMRPSPSSVSAVSVAYGLTV
jgi:sugar lactone lactonase YvrE